MRLKKIRMAGFKSFVDPTTIPITSPMTGIVGPNGCGKSNIIDAVRWVMGESSAKNLRGDSLADVIFSGSNSRKPVGRASVELVFDNTDGKAPGQYASYAEIAIRREASRDGQSDYFINKTRCRKKDITDIFLGTGLGPRSYSIIEQGMVTRIIESKPEDLRAFLEEAAGISRYKERRRETENRIRHARENLDRVNDIRSELEKQLGRLQRQAKAAAKYKELKQEERLLHAQALALRWRTLDAQLREIESQLGASDVELEKLLSAQRETEAGIESIRSRRAEAGDALNSVQEEFYGIGAEISAIEQSIQHVRDTRAQQVREHEEVDRSWNEASEHLKGDLEIIERLGRELSEGSAEMESRRRARDEHGEAQRLAEQAMQRWQSDWQIFSEASAEPAKVRDVQRSRIAQLQQHIAEMSERHQRLLQEAERIAAELGGEDGVQSSRSQAEALDRQCAQQTQEVSDLEQRLRDLRQRRQELSDSLESERNEQQQAAARLTSLRELQDAAQGKHDEELVGWLQREQLAERPRLAGRLQVEPGWERAVERVLGTAVGAVCVDDIERYRGSLGELSGAELMLVDGKADQAPADSDSRRLASLVRSDIPLGGLLNRVYIADSLDEAYVRRAALAADESIVTRDGVWMGPNWVSVSNGDSARTGVLRREHEIQDLDQKEQGLAQRVAQARGELDQIRQQLDELESRLSEAREQLNRSTAERAQLAERLGHEEARREQQEARREQLRNETAELEQRMERERGEHEDAQRLLTEAEGASGEHEQRRAQLEAERGRIQEQLERARDDAASARDAWHELELERQRRQTTLESTEQSVARLRGQLAHLEQRREELAQVLAAGDGPETELKQKLEQFLQRRLEVEQRLNSAREETGVLDETLRTREQERNQQQKRVQEQREAMEQVRVHRQELATRRDTLVEQLVETGHTLEQAREGLPEDATEAAWKEQLEGVERRISRLGAINLVAIEEYEQESERKGYLDKQHEDLTQALATLEEAMRKIDRETRTRFRETFDQVNTGMQTYFPQLFGGGHAYLELLDDDLLTTGVGVMARPPGKRNSTIHLLSGGEKALTAVALLFAIFQLNPAPFCILDEVDAPLDDANVERYSQTLKTMSDETQLLYISHNKISMEMADVLIGVTMSEPGCSRLVAVDVAEAMEMVAS
jgi:chromosome segregation protein